MQAANAGDRRRWSAAALGAAGIVAGVLVLFRVPSAPPAPFEPVARPSTAPLAPPKPQVQLAQPGAGDALLSEEMALRDMRPLFLPTEWNAALREPRREPGRTFLDNETVKLGFPVAELQIDKSLPPVATINGKTPEAASPLDALIDEPYGPRLDGFGRRETPSRMVEPEPRGALIKVVSTATGETLWTAPLHVDARPPTEKPWSPMELLAVIDAAGLASPLVVTEGSRVDEVDAHFRNYLARRYRIGERLAPGFYRIIVGP